MARDEKGDDDVLIPVNDEGDVMANHIDNEHDDQVPVEEGVELTKMLDQLEVTQAREDVKECLMAKEEYFAHGGEEGIAKSTLRFPLSRERRLARPTW